MALSSSQRNTTVFFAAAGLIGIISALYLATAGVSDASLGVLLRLSARVAFVILLLVFVARPLRQLLATPASTKLLQNRRLLGVAFAGVHSAHLGLLIFKAMQITDFELDPSANLLGAITYLAVLLMLVTSYDAAARALGPKRWKILHKVGLYWVFAAFVQTQLPESLDKLNEVNWWLVALIAIALVIRLTAFLARRR